MIFINSIKIDYSYVHYWATTEDVLTPFNPRYKEIQNYLKSLGFLESDNHNYKMSNNTLGFRVEELEYLDVPEFVKMHPSTINGFTRHLAVNFAYGLFELMTKYSDIPAIEFDAFFKNEYYNMNIFKLK